MKNKSKGTNIAREKNWPRIGVALLLAWSLVAVSGCARRTVIIREPAPPVESEVYVPEPPPPPEAEIRPSQPAPQAAWIEGHWQWNGQRYLWVPGHWDMNPRGVWVPGHWQRRPRGWFWVPGHWR